MAADPTANTAASKTETSDFLIILFLLSLTSIYNGFCSNANKQDRLNSPLTQIFCQCKRIFDLLIVFSEGTRAETACVTSILRQFCAKENRLTVARRLLEERLVMKKALTRLDYTQVRTENAREKLDHRSLIFAVMIPRVRKSCRACSLP
jgi:hypothetical protein